MEELRTEDLMSVAQAGRRLGLTPARIRQMLRAGQLGYVDTVLGRLIAPDDVERLATARRSRQEVARHDR